MYGSLLTGGYSRYAALDDSWEGPAKRWPPLRPYYMPYPMRPHIPVPAPSTPGETSATSRSTSPTESARPIAAPNETVSTSSHSTRVSFPTAVPQHPLRPLDESKSTQSLGYEKTKDLAPASTTQVSQAMATQSGESRHWAEPYNRPWGYIPRPWYPRPWDSRRRDEVRGYDEDYDEGW